MQCFLKTLTKTCISKIFYSPKLCLLFDWKLEKSEKSPITIIQNNNFSWSQWMFVILNQYCQTFISYCKLSLRGTGMTIIHYKHITIGKWETEWIIWSPEILFICFTFLIKPRLTQLLQLSGTICHTDSFLKVKKKPKQTKAKQQS